MMARSSRSQAASSSVAISSWTCLLNRPKVLRQWATAGPGPPSLSRPEVTILQYAPTSSIVSTSFVAFTQSSRVGARRTPSTGS